MKTTVLTTLLLLSSTGSACIMYRTGLLPDQKRIATKNPGTIEFRYEHRTTQGKRVKVERYPPFLKKRFRQIYSRALVETGYFKKATFKPKPGGDFLLIRVRVENRYPAYAIPSAMLTGLTIWTFPTYGRADHHISLVLVKDGKPSNEFKVLEAKSEWLGWYFIPLMPRLNGYDAELDVMRMAFRKAIRDMRRKGVLK